MAKSDFEYFSADTPNPIGKYTQPKPNPHPMGEQKDVGYPQTDVDNEGVRVKGRWPAGTLKLKHKDMQGAGAAVRGRKFLDR